MRDSVLNVQQMPRANAAPVPWIQPIFSCFFITESTAPHVWKRHCHAEFEVILVERGTYTCLLNDHPLTLAPGGLLVVKPGDWHEDTCTPRMRYVSLGFHLAPGPLGEEGCRLFRAACPPTAQCIRDAKPIFQPVFHRLAAEASRDDAVAAHLQDAVVQEFFWLLVRHLPADVLSPRFRELSAGQGFRTEVLRLFRQCIAEPLSVAAMAKHLRMSVTAFARACRAHFGAAPAHAFMQLRISEAQRLLQLPEASVTRVSEQLGFENPYHFSRVFRRHVGTSPSDWRGRL